MAFDELTGKRVVVTAGASGIGSVIALRFATAGARVHVCDVAAEALESFHCGHPEIGVTLADVAVRSDVDRMFDEALAELGGLDVLVNNAGIAGPTALTEEIDDKDWERTIAVNLNGAFLCVTRAIPLLKQGRDGSIINMSSNFGLMGVPRRSPYVATKWALIGFTRTLAIELGPFGIRVNAICPGNVEGARIERTIAAEAAARGLSRDDIVAEWVQGTSLRSFQSADDVANMILFLCSDAGAAISGQAIAIDGHVDHQ